MEASWFGELMRGCACDLTSVGTVVSAFWCLSNFVVGAVVWWMFWFSWDSNTASTAVNRDRSSQFQHLLGRLHQDSQTTVRDVAPLDCTHELNQSESKTDA